MSNSNSSAGGYGLFFILGIVFIVLKLTEVVGWSWWWVTAPIWGPFAVALAAALVLVVLVVVFKDKLKRQIAEFDASDPFDHPFFKTAR